MYRIATLTHQEKIQALSHAIRRKCRYGITSQQLRQIIDRINVNRTYFIKSTDNPVKFLNIVAEEVISSPTKTMLSYTLPIYGRFESGYFYKYEGCISSKIGLFHEHESAAALKMTITRTNSETPCVSYMLVLFECPASSHC